MFQNGRFDGVSSKTKCRSVPRVPPSKPHTMTRGECLTLLPLGAREGVSCSCGRAGKPADSAICSCGRARRQRPSRTEGFGARRFARAPGLACPARQRPCAGPRPARGGWIRAPATARAQSGGATGPDAHLAGVHRNRQPEPAAPAGSPQGPLRSRCRPQKWPGTRIWQLKLEC